jgi:hypothetical protein
MGIREWLLGSGAFRRDGPKIKEDIQPSGRRIFDVFAREPSQISAPMLPRSPCTTIPKILVLGPLMLGQLRMQMQFSLHIRMV